MRRPPAFANSHARDRRARQTRGLAAAACSLLVALLASPFAFSSSSQRIEPARATLAAAVAPSVVEAAAPAAAPIDAITFTVETPVELARPAPARTAKRTTRALAERAIDSRR